jgi:hypothetical protein
MLREHVGPPLAQLERQPCRALDVGEQECDRSRGKRSGRHDS